MCCFRKSDNRTTTIICTMLPVAAGTTVLYFLESCGWNRVGNKSLGLQTQDRALEEQSAAANVLMFGLLHSGSSGV